MGLELSEIRTFDGQTYDLMDGYSRWVLANPVGMGIPSVEAQTVKQFSRQGELLLGYNLGTRDLQVIVFVNGCNRNDYWTRRAELLDALRPNRGGELTFVFAKPDGTEYALKGMISDFDFVTGTSNDEWQEWSFTETIPIVCFDPIWFDPTAVTAAMDTSAMTTELVFPITFPIYFGQENLIATTAITYTGTWLSKPTFTIEGPFTYFAVQHTEMNVRVSLNYGAAVGETVTINLEDNTIVNQDGDDLFGYLDETSNLRDMAIYPDPQVAGGVNNLEFLATGDTFGVTTVTTTYKTRYIGI